MTNTPETVLLKTQVRPLTKQRLKILAAVTQRDMGEVLDELLERINVQQALANSA